VRRWFGLGLALVALGWCQPGLIRSQQRARFQPEPYTGADTVRFANGIQIDTRQCRTGELIPESRYWLLHFSTPVYHHWFSVLKSYGIEPVAYIAYQTMVVRLSTGSTPATFTALQQSLPIDWSGPFLPEYKLAPELLTGRRPFQELVISFWNRRPAQTINLNLTDRNARLRTINQLAGQDEIAWIQEKGAPVTFNRNVQWVLQTGWDSVIPDPVQSRRIWHYGIRGQNMLVGLFDSGINTEHDMFYDPFVPLNYPGIYPDHRKILGYKLYYYADFGDAAGANYHGSAVAGTLAGEDSITGNQTNLEGMAPEAKIFFLDIATASGQYIYSDDMTEMLDSVRLGLGLTQPVLQVSGSFGTMDYLSEYRLADATVDAVCWRDKRFLVVWAAGNGGGTSYRLGHPACAKNALTVGGCGNSTRANLIYSLSSAGPTRDERIKPNLVAPAESIWTVYGGGINAYRVGQGTSLAAPAVSGALTLLRQYLKEGWYPDGTPHPNRGIDLPSSALLRALAICATDTNVGTETIPDIRTGWGRLNLSRIIHFPDDSIAFVFVDDTLGLATGEFDEYEIVLDRREPLRAVLAWTDTAALPNAAIAIVNDLNLELESPDHNRYRGNLLIRSRSIPNPDRWDERNVEELVQIARPLTGSWKIRVYARNVFTERQPYALVIRAGIQGLPGIAEKPGPKRKATLPSRICRRKDAEIEIPAQGVLEIYSATGARVARLRNPGTRPLRYQFGVDRRFVAGVYIFQLTTKNQVQSGRIVLF
jgi:hypothetical protein